MALETKNSKLYLNGKEITLYSGAMHYFRVVPEYWRDRLLKMKACGLNCVETYVPWNSHEKRRGQFNFEGMLDIRRFLQTAHEVGLYVLLRPGPYICAEWDFGGLPSWLLRDPNMKVRSSYQPYLDAVDRYFAQLLPLVADLQFQKGGPIIAVQIENEYGSFGDDIVYKTFLKDNMEKYGICEMFFTSDNGTGVQTGQVPETWMTANFQEEEHGFLMFEYFKNLKQPGKPLMVMEFWSGWFDHWGEQHSVWPVEKFESVFRWILKQNSSVNFYMFHGGTNWGFWNGANEDLGATNEGGGEPYCPDITSYDYDCQISENGELTEKYFKTREIIREVTGETLPDPPPNIPTKAYAPISCSGTLTLDDLLTLVDPVKVSEPCAMELLDVHDDNGQGYGFTLYRAQVPMGKRLSYMGAVKDRVQILLNGAEEAVYDWKCQQGFTQDLFTIEERNTLDLLAENCGRVNYADFRSPLLDNQRKGLHGPVHFGGEVVSDWSVYPLEFEAEFLARVSDLTWREFVPGDVTKPTLNRFLLTLNEAPTADTFINMAEWQKGVVFVNGFNLGRYWSIGPQQTLYLPAPLLKQGENEILVFELHRAAGLLQLTDRPELGPCQEHRTVIPRWAQTLILSLRYLVKLGPWVWKIIRLFLK